jgi:hypothetical protein
LKSLSKFQTGAVGVQLAIATLLALAISWSLNFAASSQSCIQSNNASVILSNSESFNGLSLNSKNLFIMSVCFEIIFASALVSASIARLDRVFCALIASHIKALCFSSSIGYTSSNESN